jgi:hypothetical protein
MDTQELLDAIAGKPLNPAEQQAAEDKKISSVKGQPQKVLTDAQSDRASGVVYMGDAVVASIQILCSGSTPVGTFIVQGAPSEGGNWDTLPESAATQTNLNAGKIFDVTCRQVYLRVALSSVTGTYAAGQGWTVIVTPCSK